MNTPRIAAAAAILAACATTGSVQADTVLGVYAGAGTWQQGFGGDIASSSIIDIDVEQDLGLDDKGNNIFYFALEHFVPMVPNVRLQYADISVTGDNVLDREIEFNGTTFVINSDVATNVDVTQMDAIAYYEILDNVVSLDLGLAVRYLDGDILIQSDFEVGEATFTGFLPLVYGRARVDLPFTGGWAAADVHAIAYNGNQLVDASARLGWESEIGLGFEVGYRSWQLSLEDIDDIDDAELDVSGPFAALNYHF